MTKQQSKIGVVNCQCFSGQEQPHQRLPALVLTYFFSITGSKLMLPVELVTCCITNKRLNESLQNVSLFVIVY